MPYNPYEHQWSDTPSTASDRSRARYIPTWAPFALLALLAAAAVGGYLGVCAFMGAKQELFIVNGTATSYLVEVDGRQITLEPFVTNVLEVGQGSIPVRVVTGPDAGDAITVEIDTPLWMRPFDDSVFVVNPDRTAVLEWEQCAYYDERNMPLNDDPNYRLEYHFGEQSYRFDDIDFAFEPFPDEVWLSDTSSFSLRTRVAVATYLTHEDIVDMIGRQPDRGKAADFCRASLKYFPEFLCYYDGLREAVGEEQMLAHIQPLLDQRPLVLEAHIAAQDARLADTPVDEVRADHERELERSPDEPALMYLVARLTRDPRASEALIACAADHPDTRSVIPRRRLLRIYLATGRFQQALEQAEALQPVGEDGYVDGEALYDLLQSYLALGRRAEAYEVCRQLLELDPYWSYYRQLELSLLEALGRSDEVPGAMSRFMSVTQADQLSPSVQQQWRHFLKAHVQLVRDQREQAANSFERTGDPYYRFFAAALRGQLARAEQHLRDDDQPPLVSDWMALAVCAERDGRGDLADRYAAQAAALIDPEETGDSAVVAALRGSEFDIDTVLTSVLSPLDKTLVLTWIGQRHPAHRQRCFELAGRLNFADVFPSCLVDDVIASSSAGRDG